MEAFPMPIAIAMLDGKTVSQISKDPVSILYSDIVGFTAMSSAMDAVQVSRMIHRLFSHLDRLAYIHGVQKVDVIGDAYVAATNFTENQPADHAARLARFAIAAAAAARSAFADKDGSDRRRRPASGVQLRIGMHCGAVFGGVIGPRGSKYTLVGEAVNVAARMEQTCLPGRIQCSAAIARAIEEQPCGLLLRRRSRTHPPARARTRRGSLAHTATDPPRVVLALIWRHARSALDRKRHRARLHVALSSLTRTHAAR